MDLTKNSALVRQMTKLLKSSDRGSNQNCWRRCLKFISCSKKDLKSVDTEESQSLIRSEQDEQLNEFVKVKRIVCTSENITGKLAPLRLS